MCVHLLIPRDEIDAGKPEGSDLKGGRGPFNGEDMRQEQSAVEKTDSKNDQRYTQSKKFKNLLIKNE